jgi:hypothetical protein
LSSVSLCKALYSGPYPDPDERGARKLRQTPHSMLFDKPDQRIAELRELAATFVQIEQPRFANHPRILRAKARTESRRRQNGEDFRGVQSSRAYG